MGEDGTVQGLLEMAGVPYCGAGVAGSAAAMDKGLAKALLAAAGLPQARYPLLRETDIGADLAERVEAELGWPVFVKPANMGSSIGMSRVADAGGLAAAIDLVRRYDEFVIIEEAVRGRELEIGVLGLAGPAGVGARARSCPATTSTTSRTSTWTARPAWRCPARLPDGVAEEMGRLAVAACRALRVDCMARVDFFFEEGGRGPAGQRGQHHPRLHADLDVPPAVGGVRRSVPGAGRRAGQPGPPACGPPGPVRGAPPVSRVARHRSLQAGTP